MDRVNIKGLDKAEVFRVLYNRAKTQGMGIRHYTPEDMTIEEARATIQDRLDNVFEYDGLELCFDYHKGRVMKVDIAGNDFDPSLYDRDNGERAAQDTIDTIPNCSGSRLLDVSYKEEEEA